MTVESDAVQFIVGQQLVLQQPLQVGHLHLIEQSLVVAVSPPHHPACLVQCFQEALLRVTGHKLVDYSEGQVEDGALLGGVPESVGGLAVKVEEEMREGVALAPQQQHSPELLSSWHVLELEHFCLCEGRHLHLLLL